MNCSAAAAATASSPCAAAAAWERARSWSASPSRHYGAIFALVRWSSNDYGTLESRIDILQAVRTQDPCSTVPCVTPGGELLLRLSGWPKVEAALRSIDTVESYGIAPEEVCPDHWRHVHNRLTAALETRAYTPARHAAWLKRRMMTT